MDIAKLKPIERELYKFTRSQLLHHYPPLNHGLDVQLADKTHATEAIKIFAAAIEILHEKDIVLKYKDEFKVSKQWKELWLSDEIYLYPSEVVHSVLLEYSRKPKHSEVPIT